MDVPVLPAMPDLERRCDECDGDGGWFYDGGGVYCNACHGSGFVPTDSGVKLREFIKHTLRQLQSQ